MRSRTCMLMLTACLITPGVSADTAYVDGLIDSAIGSGLHDSRAWFALMHYKPGLFGRLESEADGAAFFLHEEGKTDPKLELVATLRALAGPVEDAADDLRCRFPARYHWLDQVLDIDESRLVEVECEEYEEWFEIISPGSVKLIFPAAYINSPASMFGHTLLRIDPDDHRKDSPLVAHALNYAANVDPRDNAISFSLKGLIGGYPGSFSLVPYYKKIREYSDIENRDMWEYELDFDTEEVRQLMRHAWELRDIHFDYYFLTENCSYHMLSLMEVARPELDLTSVFRFKAIPADTVRVVQQAGLIRSAEYRPSSTRILEEHASQMNVRENELVRQLVDGDKKIEDIDRGLPAERRAMLFEQAYDYARFLATADPTVRDARASLNWQLLSARAETGVTGLWEPVSVPEVRAEQGHRTGRLALGAGSIDDEAYVRISLRPAFHDVLDPPAGYSPGAQINFLDASFLYQNDDDAVRLDKLTFINVLSITPRDTYFSPISWGVDFALERQPTLTSTANAIQLVVNGGWSYGISSSVVSLLGEANVKVDDDYRKGHSAGLGLKLGLLYQGDRLSLGSSLKAVRFGAGEKNDHARFDLTLSLPVGADQALRLNAERILDYDLYRTDLSLSWHHYF